MKVSSACEACTKAVGNALHGCCALLQSRSSVLNCYCSDAVFGLERKFADQYNMLCIHMWMLLVRLRSEGKDGKDLAQMMYESFQENVEARVRGEGVKVCSLLRLV